MRRLLSLIKLGYLTLMQDRLIFKPSPRNVEDMKEAADYGLSGVKDVYLTTDDGVELHLWLSRAEMQERQKSPNPLCIVFHGNTGHWGDVGAPQEGESYDRAYRIGLLKTLQTHSIDFMAVSLRGYGKSISGVPSEQGWMKDLRAVAEYVLDLQQDRDNPVIVLGESLGGAMALQMAVVLSHYGKAPNIVGTIAAFASMREKVCDLHPDLRDMPIERYLRHSFDNKHTLERMSKETICYFFHPEKDETTPLHHLEMLYEQAIEHNKTVRKIILTGASHIVWESDAIIGELLAALPEQGLEEDDEDI